jgi:hypothetical protein
LDKRPKLAAGIGRVTAAWSEIDVEFGILLAILLGTQARIGVAMYLSLAGSPAQRSTLLAAAEASALPEDMLLKIEALSEEMRTRVKERNNVVHAVWSIYPGHRDRIINCPPENLVRDVANTYESYARIFDILEEPPSKEFMKALRYYTAKDFDQIVNRIKDFKSEIMIVQNEIGLYLDAVRSLAAAQESVLREEEALSRQEAARTPNPSKSS